MIRETENRCVGMPPLSVVKGMRQIGRAHV